MNTWIVCLNNLIEFMINLLLKITKQSWYIIWWYIIWWYIISWYIISWYIIWWYTIPVEMFCYQNLELSQKKNTFFREKNNNHEYVTLTNAIYMTRSWTNAKPFSFLISGPLALFWELDFNPSSQTGIKCLQQ